MFLLRLFHFFLFVIICYTFPLKDCSSKTTELLFFIDCRHEFSQLQDIQIWVTYLRVDRNWNISNITYRTLSKNGLYTLNESDIFSNTHYFDLIKINCSEKLDQFVAVQEAKEWCQEKVSATRIAFIFHITDSNCKHSFYQNVKNEFFRASNKNIYFILYSIHVRQSYFCITQNGIGYYYMYLQRGLDLFYSKICSDAGCPSQDLTYTTENIQQSFYHVNFTFPSISSKEAFEYCSKIPKNYLISLETMDELDFIFHYLKNVSSQNSLSKLHLHIGFRDLCNSWPTFLKCKSFFKSCLVLTFTKYNEDYELFTITNTNRTIYFKAIDCTDQINNSIVICECHTHLTQKQLIQNIFSENDKEFLIRKYTLYDLAQLFFKASKSKFMKFGITDLETIICNNSTRLIDNNIDCGALLNNTETNVMHIYSQIEELVVLQNESLLKCLQLSNFEEITREKKSGYDFDVTSFNYNDSLVDGIGNGCTLPTLNLSLETIQNEKNSELTYKCIYDLGPLRFDYPHLKNCEKFICPKNFLKCPNSYCIRLDQLGDNRKNCRFGEDEVIFRPKICYGNINFAFMDMCISLDNSDLIPNHYKCSKICPPNYKCVSSKKNKNNIKTDFEIFSMRLELYNISNVIFPNLILLYFLKLHILQFQAIECKLKNFDVAMRYWNLHQLYSLDLSFNELESSKDFQTVCQMKKLRILNMSFNPITKINNKFQFPNQMEIIDLSNTRLFAIPLNAFNNLNQLRLLSLKNTFITTFKDTGIPEYFSLHNLYLQELIISNLETNFFKGLTIRSGLWTSDFRLCCPQVLNSNISSDKCHGPIDVISSCENLVGDVFKRFVIWIVGLVTIVGNGIVLAYRLALNREIFKKAYGLYVTGLAFSDFLMGIYLMIISSVDIYYQDVYVLEETQWRNGILCKISGFLSTLSSETSTFFICLITLDRYLSITYPFGEYRLSKYMTRVLFTKAWIIGIVLAAVPLVVSNWEIYSSNSLCLALPFSSNHFSGWEFSFVVYVGVNFLLFILIAAGQVAIFVNIYRKKQSMSFLKNCPKRRLEDLAVAKKLAFVAMSDFLCWFPIGVFGYFSMKGHTFDRDVYAWFAVFVLPINSALNPIIYTIPTLYVKCSANLDRTIETSFSTM